MFALWMFGSILENLWGPKRFLVFYLVCGLGAALCHMIILYYQMQPLAEAVTNLPLVKQQELLSNPLFKLNESTLGASGAIFGCLAAFGYLFPNTYIYLYFFFPIKAKWFVLGYAAVELFMGVKGSAGDNVAHFAHLGGALIGIILVYYWNKKNRRNFY
jgi:membrane associated rhomboid family serine protease